VRSSSETDSGMRVGGGEPLDTEVLRILELLAEGASAAEVTRTCAISRSTMWRRVHEVAAAWGLGTPTEVVVAAVRRGLI
jgi:DNA-binding NarL/FixJ family response regulator